MSNLFKRVRPYDQYVTKRPKTAMSRGRGRVDGERVASVNMHIVMRPTDLQKLQRLYCSYDVPVSSYINMAVGMVYHAHRHDEEIRRILVDPRHYFQEGRNWLFKVRMSIFSVNRIAAIYDRCGGKTSKADRVMQVSLIVSLCIRRFIQRHPDLSLDLSGVERDRARMVFGYKGKIQKPRDVEDSLALAVEL